jgi:hypothetical protein
MAFKKKKKSKLLEKSFQFVWLKLHLLFKLIRLFFFVFELIPVPELKAEIEAWIEERLASFENDEN